MKRRWRSGDSSTSPHVRLASSAIHSMEATLQDRGLLWAERGQSAADADGQRRPTGQLQHGTIHPVAQRTRRRTRRATRPAACRLPGSSGGRCRRGRPPPPRASAAGWRLAPCPVAPPRAQTARPRRRWRRASRRRRSAPPWRWPAPWRGCPPVGLMAGRGWADQVRRRRSRKGNARSDGGRRQAAMRKRCQPRPSPPSCRARQSTARQRSCGPAAGPGRLSGP